MGDKLPPPVAGKRGKNIVAGLRVNGLTEVQWTYSYINVQTATQSQRL